MHNASLRFVGGFIKKLYYFYYALDFAPELNKKMDFNANIPIS